MGWEEKGKRLEHGSEKRGKKREEEMRDKRKGGRKRREK